MCTNVWYVLIYEGYLIVVKSKPELYSSNPILSRPYHFNTTCFIWNFMQKESVMFFFCLFVCFLFCFSFFLSLNV